MPIIYTLQSIYLSMCVCMCVMFFFLSFVGPKSENKTFKRGIGPQWDYFWKNIYFINVCIIKYLFNSFVYFIIFDHFIFF